MKELNRCWNRNMQQRFVRVGLLSTWRTRSIREINTENEFPQGGKSSWTLHSRRSVPHPLLIGWWHLRLHGAKMCFCRKVNSLDLLLRDIITQFIGPRQVCSSERALTRISPPVWQKKKKIKSSSGFSRETAACWYVNYEYAIMYKA